jgi:F-type H+-transporting ATPase subunit b
MLEFNATLLFVFVSFIIFMVLMKVIYFDPMLRLMREREQKTVGDKALAIQAQSDYQSLLADYDKQLGQSRKQANQLIQEKRQDAGQQVQQIIASSRATAQQESTEKMNELATQQATVYQELSSQKADLKEQIIWKIRKNAKVGVF